MGTGKIDSAEVNNFSAKQYKDTAAAQDLTQYPSSFSTQNASSTSETEYQNTKWNEQFGAYLEISEFAGLIDTKARYVVGKGFKADPTTTKILSSIKGNGLDSSNMIFYNAVRNYTLGGDFYAEIIKNKRGVLRNLKPLNPSTIKVIANDKGMITGYEQFAENNSKNIPETKFKPEEIFHLAYNRIADQIHGQSIYDKLQGIIEMRKESMQDMRVVFHRYVKPLIISSVDTDDETEIAAYKTKLDNAMAKGENMVVPKGVLDNMEKVSIPQFSTLDPLPWIKLLQREFIKAEGTPGVAMGIADEASEAESKILYLGWQQVVEFNQMFLEEQIKSQLGLTVEFEFPASIAPELINDEKKDPNLNSMGTEAGKDQK